MTKKIIGKIANVLLNTLLVLFFIVCVFGLFLSVSAKKSSDGAVDLFGYEARFVLTESMEKNKDTDTSKFKIKEIKQKSLVFIEKVPTNEKQAEKWYAALKIGDVLTFRYGNIGEPITHRIVDIEEKKNTGGYIITLRGDNHAEGTQAAEQVVDTSQKESLNYIIGKVKGQSYALGLLVYAVKTPVGIVFIVIVPCLIIIGLEILRIVSVLNESKKQKQAEEKAKQEDEIERLKKRLLELESKEKTQDAAAVLTENEEKTEGE